MNLDAFYLVKLIFGEYFCYFDSNRIAVLFHLQLYLDANRVLVRKRVNGLIVAHTANFTHMADLIWLFWTNLISVLLFYFIFYCFAHCFYFKIQN